MLKDITEAMLGRRPFDLVIRNVQIVNVFSASIVSGSIGIVNGHIAGVFGPEEALDISCIWLPLRELIRRCMRQPV